MNLPTHQMPTSVAELSPMQRELLANFGNMEKVAQDTFFLLSRQYARILPRQRPQLTVVEGGDA